MNTGSHIVDMNTVSHVALFCAALPLLRPDCSMPCSLLIGDVACMWYGPMLMSSATRVCISIVDMLRLEKEAFTVIFWHILVFSGEQRLI